MKKEWWRCERARARWLEQSLVTRLALRVSLDVARRMDVDCLHLDVVIFDGLLRYIRRGLGTGTRDGLAWLLAVLALALSSPLVLAASAAARLASLSAMAASDAASSSWLVQNLHRLALIGTFSQQ